MEKKLLHRTKTAFNDVWIFKEGSILTLYSPSSIRQTVIDENEPFVPLLEYAINTILGLVFYPDPKSILVLGLGGGSIPMMFYNICKNAYIDVVEIDPEIAHTAKMYFHFNTSSRLHLYIDDASSFVKKSKKHYDTIILDAYIGDEFPPSLSTPDFFKELKRILSLNGILIANVMSKDRRKFKKFLKKNEFKNNEIWLLPGIQSNNIVVFASMEANISKEYLLSQTNLLQKNLPFDLQLVNLVKKLKHP